MTCEDHTMNWTLIFEGLVALASIIAIIVSCKALKRSDKANAHADKANTLAKDANTLAKKAIEISESQETGQKEKRDELWEALDLSLGKLTAMQDSLYPKDAEIDSNGIWYAVKMHETDLPDTGQLRKTARKVSNQTVRETSTSALHEVDNWKEGVWGVWSVISELPGRTHDEQVAREQAIGRYYSTRDEFSRISKDFKSSIERAIAVIEAVESGEAVDDSPARN